MKEKYFTELARRLLEERIFTETGGNHLSVLLHGQVAMNVTQDGTVLLMPGASGDREASGLYHEVSGLASAVKEYTTAMERAPLLQARALDPAYGYRLLADFNGVVLAGQELEKGRGYQFATWRWDNDRKGVNTGDFYNNDFEGAKLSFVGRSGLVQKERLLTDEQLAELYRGSEFLLDEGPEPTPQQAEALTSARKQIEEAVPDLQERLEQGQVQDPILNM